MFVLCSILRKARKKKEKGTLPTPVVTEVENSSIPFRWAKSGRIAHELQSRVCVSLVF